MASSDKGPWTEDVAVDKVKPDIYRTAIAFQNYQAAIQALRSPNEDAAPTEEQIAELLTRAAFKYFDQGGDGKLEFAAERLAFKNRVADLRGPEYIVDVDGDGRVSRTELANVAGFPLTFEEALRLFDVNGDGALSMYEFYRAMQAQGLRDDFREALEARQAALLPPQPPEPAPAAAPALDLFPDEPAVLQPERVDASEAPATPALPAGPLEVIEVPVGLPARPEGYTSPAPATPLPERQTEGEPLDAFLARLAEAEAARSAEMVERAKLAPPMPPGPAAPAPPPAAPAPPPAAKPAPPPPPPPARVSEAASGEAARVQHDVDGDGRVTRGELKGAILREYSEAFGAFPHDDALETTLDGLMGAFQSDGERGPSASLSPDELRVARAVLHSDDVAWAVVQKIGPPAHTQDDGPVSPASRSAPTPLPPPPAPAAPAAPAARAAASSVPPVDPAAVAALRNSFVTADKDGDGGLSRGEWAARLEQAVGDAGLLGAGQDVAVMGAIDREVQALFAARPVDAAHAVDIAVDGAGPAHKMGAGEYAQLALRSAAVTGGPVRDPFQLVAESVADNLGLPIRPAPGVAHEWEWAAADPAEAAAALPAEAAAEASYVEDEEAAVEWGDLPAPDDLL